ncbi:MAG: MaoC family dehydratase [Bacteroidota bacterium]
MAKLVVSNLKEFKTWKGKALPKGDWLVVTQEMIDAFAKATQDFQWIHVDVEKAEKLSPFRKPVAHGFLSLSLFSKMLGDLVTVKSAKMGLNYGLNKVRFPSPVLVDSRLRISGSIVEVEPYGATGLKITWNCTAEIENSEKPACVAEFISLLFE